MGTTLKSSIILGCLILTLLSVVLCFRCFNGSAVADEFPYPQSATRPILTEQSIEKMNNEQKINGLDVNGLENKNYDSKYLTGSTLQSVYLTRIYLERIRENEDEIRFLINEKDWLQNRIYHLQDLNEPVPWEMQNSIMIKETKIRAAFRENGRLNELLKQERYKNVDISGFSHGNIYSKDSSFSAFNCESLQKRLSQEIRDANLDEWLYFTSDGGEFCKGEKCCALENVLPILFASGSARLANEYKVFLKRLAELVKNYDIRIRIDGFADVDNIHTKQYPSNFELGATRAANIVHELVKNGVRPSVFRIATTGKYRPDGKPMSDNKSLERRAEISVVFISPA